MANATLPRNTLFGGSGATSDGTVAGYSRPFIGYGEPAYVTVSNPGGAEVIMQRRQVPTAVLPNPLWADWGDSRFDSTTKQNLLLAGMEYRFSIISAGTLVVTTSLQHMEQDKFENDRWWLRDGSAQQFDQGIGDIAGGTGQSNTLDFLKLNRNAPNEGDVPAEISQLTNSDPKDSVRVQFLDFDLWYGTPNGSVWEEKGRTPRNTGQSTRRHREITSSTDPAPRYVETPTELEIVDIANAIGLQSGDAITYVTNDGAYLDFDLATSNNDQLVAIRITRLPEYSVVPDFNNFEAGVDWSLAITVDGQRETGYINDHGNYSETTPNVSVSPSDGNYIDVNAENESRGTDEFFDKFPDPGTVDLWTEARVTNVGVSGKTEVFYRGIFDGNPVWIHLGTLSEGVPQIALILDPIATDNAISATERVADVDITATTTNVANGTEVQIIVTDTQNRIINRLPTVTSNSATATLNPSDLRDLVGPLLVTARVSVDDDLITDQRVVPLEVAQLIVDPINDRDNLFTHEESLTAKNITGIAPPNVAVSMSGAKSVIRQSDSEGNFIFTLTKTELANYVRDIRQTLHFDVSGIDRVTIDFEIETQAAAPDIPAVFTMPEINPADPEGFGLTLTHQDTGGMVVQLRAVRENVILWQKEKENVEGDTATNFLILSDDVAQMVAPTVVEARTIYAGRSSLWQSVAVEYEEVVDPVTEDPLPTAISTIKYPIKAQNRHRKNTGPSTMYFKDGNDEKQLSLIFASNNRWFVGMRDFPDGEASMVDIHDVCNLNTQADNHNYGAVGVSNAGKFVWTCDMHAPTTYAVQGGYTTDPYDYDFSSAQPLTESNFPNNLAESPTYPQFFRHKGDLFLAFRELDRGGGANFIYYIFQWLDASNSFALVATLNAGVHLRLYISDIVTSPDDSLVGFVGIFRDDSTSSDGTHQQHDLFIIWSDDKMQTWKSHSGAQSMPVWWNNGAGTKGITAHFVNDLVIDTGATGDIPLKPGAFCWDENNVPHIITEIRSSSVFLFSRNGSSWDKYKVPFDEGTSRMWSYGGQTGVIVHRGNNVYLHPIDKTHPRHTSGYVLANDLVSGAFVVRQDGEATKAGYVAQDLFKCQSSGLRDTGSYPTDMFHRVTPATQLGVDVVESPDLEFTLDPIGGDGIISVPDSQGEIKVRGAVSQAGRITFLAPFDIQPITMAAEGPFESAENIASLIAEVNSAVPYSIKALFTAADGRTATREEPFEFHNYIPSCVVSRSGLQFNIVTDSKATSALPGIISGRLLRDGEEIYVHPDYQFTIDSLPNTHSHTVAIPQSAEDLAQDGDLWEWKLTNYWGNFSIGTLSVGSGADDPAYPPTRTDYPWNTQRPAPAVSVPTALFTWQASDLGDFEVARISNDQKEIAYASRSSFSRLCTYVMVLGDSAEPHIYDMQGNLVLRLGSEFNSEVTFANTDDRLVYGIGKTNRVRVVNVTTGNVSDIATFPEYSQLRLGDAQGCIDERDDRTVLVGIRSDGTREVFVFSLKTGLVIGPRITINGSFDYANISPTGNWAVYTESDVLYKAPYSDLLQAVSTGFGRDHGDLGFDAAGNESAIFLGNGDIDFLNLETNQSQKIQVQDPNEGIRWVSGHGSCRALKRKGWAGISTLDHTKLFMIKVVAAPTYGDPLTIEDWGFSRAGIYDRPNNQDAPYSEQARANWSHDGLCVAFNSRWDNQLPNADAFMIRYAP